jgi:hypothetical protein
MSTEDAEDADPPYNPLQEDLEPLPLEPFDPSELRADPMYWELLELFEPSEPSEPSEPFVNGMFDDGRTVHPEHVEHVEHPVPDLNTLLFYPRQVPHMFVNVSRSHWDEMRVEERACSICFEKFDGMVTELNCTHGKEGKHFFCQECANAWWRTCLAGNHVPSCACCRTATASAVTWVKPRKRSGAAMASVSKKHRVEV